MSETMQAVRATAFEETWPKFDRKSSYQVDGS